MSNNSRHYNIYITHSCSTNIFHIPYKSCIYKSETSIIVFQKTLFLISSLY